MEKYSQAHLKQQAELAAAPPNGIRVNVRFMGNHYRWYKFYLKLFR